MQIRSKQLTYDAIKSLMERVGIADYEGNIVAHNDSRPLYGNGNGYAGRLVAVSSRAPGARRSWSGRRTTAVCWHGFRDAFRAVLEVDPDAVIVTSMARYRGRDGFEQTYPGTADVNIGSQFTPAYMPELCECDDEDKRGWAYRAMWRQGA